MALIRMSGRSPALSLGSSFIDELPERIRRMLEGSLEPVQAVGWMPAMEIRDKKDALVLTAELPGLTGKDINIGLEDDVLTISGEKREEKKEGDEESKYYLWERRYGAFHRSFTLPSAVDADKITADFDGGVLTVTLPKTEKVKAKERKIAITAKK